MCLEYIKTKVLRYRSAHRKITENSTKRLTTEKPFQDRYKCVYEWNKMSSNWRRNHISHGESEQEHRIYRKLRS